MVWIYIKRHSSMWRVPKRQILILAVIYMILVNYLHYKANNKEIISGMPILVYSNEKLGCFKKERKRTHLYLYTVKYIWKSFYSRT